MGRHTVRRAAARQASGLAADLADLVHTLARGLFDAYRPELHYMRGPGPKWREKHGGPHATRSGAVVKTLRGASA